MKRNARSVIELPAEAAMFRTQESRAAEHSKGLS